MRHLLLAAVVMVLVAGPVGAQCILANPSFELGGSGGAVFGGWNQFGVVGSVTDAVHGTRAARVSGPGGGGWGVSGYWQRLDSAPGERWLVTGHVRHPGVKPLTGPSAALVNIEWRNAAGDLIDYDSFTVADAATTPDTYHAFEVLSAPAPAGTAAIHALFGVLQGPGEPSPDVSYDQVTVHSTSTPTIDDLQWADFGGGRAVVFAGRTWRVKGPGYFGPGPNVFCHGPQCVWVDDSGFLHLTLAYRSGNWASTEVVLEDALGYGDYVVTLEGRLDLLDPQAVLGLFLWQYGPCWNEAYFWWNPYNEVDIEYSRWGNPANAIGQFVAQPYDYPGNLARFAATFADGEVTSHAMRWLPDRVEYRAWRGGPGDEATATMIHAWTYTGPHVPRPEQPRLHLNLWKLAGGDPASAQEVIVRGFTFVPAGTATAVESAGSAPDPGLRLLDVAPNPFNPQTTIRFEVDRTGPIALTVHDLAGRRVRTLLDGVVPSGSHAAAWDGRGQDGRVLASGVYLVRLRGNGEAVVRRVVMVR